MLTHTLLNHVLAHCPLDSSSNEARTQLWVNGCLWHTSNTTVYDGMFGQQYAAIKLVDPRQWEPPGSYRWESGMYRRLPGLQQAGVIPTFFGYGYLDGVVRRYCTAMSIVHGVPLSAMEKPFSKEVRHWGGRRTGRKKPA